MFSRCLCSAVLALVFVGCTADDQAPTSTVPSSSSSSTSPSTTTDPETTVDGTETTVETSETTGTTVDETLDVEVPDVVAATPSTPDAPYYPTEFPVDVDSDLVIYGDGPPATGEVLELSGAVVSTDGERLEGATVEIWHADAGGTYPHSDAPGFGDHDSDFQGFGFTTTNANGAYLLRTVLPGTSEEGPAHINVKVNFDGREVLNTRIHLTGEGIDDPPADVPEALVTEVSAGESALEATFVLAVDI